MQNGNAPEIVDPALSRRKFERELNAFRSIASTRLKQGWLMLKADFPEVVVAFAAPQLKPAPVLFGVRVTFENYDLWPPSVVFINPFTAKPLIRREQVRVAPLLRQVPGSAVIDVPGVGQVRQPQELLIAHSDDEIPFLCLPGVREYHAHPAHTGDDWLSHRGTGEGTLNFVLETIYKYGVAPIRQYQYGITISGLNREVPE